MDRLEALRAEAGRDRCRIGAQTTEAREVALDDLGGNDATGATPIPVVDVR